MRRPRGLLFDYGDTLVEEVEFNARAGNERLLTHARGGLVADHLERVIERADRVSREVAERRDLFQIETPWASLTRLIHDFCGTQFTVPLADLELAFWDASVTTRPMPGVRDALTEFQRAGIPMGVVSNSSFGQAVIRHELAKHDLDEFMTVVVASAEYAVRKPNPLLFETAAALLSVQCSDVWFVGDRLDTDVAGAKAAGMTAVQYGPVTWPDIATRVREADE